MSVSVSVSERVTKECERLIHSCFARRSFSTSRVYISSVEEGGGIFNALCTCVENMLVSKSSVEACVTSMIALQKLSLELRPSFLALKFGVLKRVGFSCWRCRWEEGVVMRGSNSWPRA